MCCAVLALLVLIFVTTSVSLQIVPLTTSCSDIAIGYCEIRFVLPSEEAYTLESPEWLSHIADVQPAHGTCVLQGSNLILTPPKTPSAARIAAVRANPNIVQCSFQVRDGSVAGEVRLGTEHDSQILPRLAFSHFELGFTPISQAERLRCRDSHSTEPCNATFSSGSDLFPLVIRTTAKLSISSCQVDEADFNQIGIQLSNSQGAINTYTLSLASNPVPAAQISCTMEAQKASHGPLFHVLKGDLVVYENFDIQLNTIEIVKLPFCSRPESPVCPLAFYIDDDIDISDLSIQPSAYFYQMLEPVSEKRCAILDQTRIPPQAGKRLVCGVFRKTLHTLDSFLPTALNQFLLSSQPSYPEISFIMGGKFFVEQRVTFNVNNPEPVTIYTNPIVLTQTQEQQSMCNNPHVPVCPMTLTSFYQGPPVKIHLSQPPLLGIDFHYCKTVNGFKSAMSVGPNHDVIINSENKLVTLPDPWTPWKCVILYYKYHISDRPLPDPIVMVKYDETLGARSATFRSFLPESTVGQMAITNSHFNNIPLQYNNDPNCSNGDVQDCTIEIYVDFDVNNPMNYMRSFDIFLPLLDFDFASIRGRTSFSTAGFSSSEVSIKTIVSVNDDLDHVPFKFIPTIITNLKADSQSAYFRVEIRHNFGQLFNTNKIDHLYPRDTLRHSIFLTYPKLLDSSHSVTPTLLKYNGKSLSKLLSEQPAGLSLPHQLNFHPVIALRSTASCLNPNNANCLIVLERFQIRSKYVYFRPLDPILAGTFESLLALGAVKQFEAPDGAVLTQIDFSIVGGSQYFITPQQYLPLVKPYGTSDNPTVGIVAVLENSNFEPILAPPKPDSPTGLPVLTILHSYQWQIGFAYTNDLKPTFDPDCSALGTPTCTISYKSTSPVLLRTAELVLIKHRIPKWVETPAILPGMTPAQQSATITARLAMDWSQQDGIVKEPRTPIAIYSSPNLGTFNLAAYLKAQVELVPNSSPANYGLWVATGGQTELVLPPSLPADMILPAHRAGDIFFRVDLSHDSYGDSYLSIVAFIKPLLIAWRDPVSGDLPGSIVNGKVACQYDPKTPRGACQLDLVNSIVTGVFTGYSILNGRPVSQDGFSLTIQLGLWSALQSSKVYTRPSLIHGIPVPYPERITPFVFPSTGYYPVQIQPMPDCMNSYKTGDQTCSFVGDSFASELYPISNFTYISSFQYSNNWMMNPYPAYVYTKLIDPRDDIDDRYIDLRVGTLKITLAQNSVTLRIFPQWRSTASRFYMMFIDIGRHPGGKLVDLPPFLLPPLYVPLYINIDYDDALVPYNLMQMIQDPRFSVPIGGKLAAGQPVFFKVPPMANGPILQALTNQTQFRYKANFVHYALIQYRFAALFKEMVMIDNNFGYDFPVPCFEIPIDPETGYSPGINYSQPAVTLEKWKVIMAALRQVVIEFATAQAISVTRAKSLIPLSTLPLGFDILPNQAISGWMYPESDGSSTLRTTTPAAANNEFPSFQINSSCAVWIPVTSKFPTNQVGPCTHRSTLISLLDLYRFGTTTNPTLSRQIVDYTTDLTYPQLVKSAQIAAPLENKPRAAIHKVTPNTNGTINYSGIKNIVSFIPVVVVVLLVNLIGLDL